MKYFYFKILLLVLILTQSCGYQPLLTENQKFSVDSFNFSGDRKLGQMLANKFSKVENAKYGLVFNIRADKIRRISNKSSAGVILEYTTNITFDLEILSILEREIVLKKTFSETTNYKASDLNIDTLNRERKINQDLISIIAAEINTQLNLIYKSK